MAGHGLPAGRRALRTPGDGQEPGSDRGSGRRLWPGCGLAGEVALVANRTREVRTCTGILHWLSSGTIGLKVLKQQISDYCHPSPVPHRRPCVSRDAEGPSWLPSLVAAQSPWASHLEGNQPGSLPTPPTRRLPSQRGRSLSPVPVSEQDEPKNPPRQELPDDRSNPDGCRRCGWWSRPRTTTTPSASTATCWVLPRKLRIHGDDGAKVTILDVGRATPEFSNPDQVEHDRPGRSGSCRVSPRLRVAFQVADAEGVTRELAEAGAQVIAPVTVTPCESRSTHVLQGAGRSPAHALRGARGGQ